MAQLRNLPRDGSQPELWQPDSGWRPYDGPLPRLAEVDVAIDTETRDDGLARGIGPGWVYGLGHLCGVSAAWGDSHIYVPVRHPDTACRPIGEVLNWVEGILRSCTVYFFNSGYDLAWLWEEGLRIWPENFHDASLMSVMLDENQFDYSLDGCCARAGVQCKDERLLEEAARSYGVGSKDGIWRMPARFVGPYAEQDAVSTLQLGRLLLERVRADGMEGAYRTELRLVRVLYEMRKRGIRISEDRAADGISRIHARRDQALAEVRHLSGIRADMEAVRSPDALGKIFESVDIICPITPKTGKPSVTKEWLQGLHHPLGAAVRAARRFDDLGDKFINTYILGHMHRGRLHAEIHQLRDSEGGARTHRLSYANPPLQQTPSRPDKDDPEDDKLLVQAVRSCFLPEDGEIWFAPDYSGQEPRFVVHLAAACKIPSGIEMAARWREDPRLDYHTTVAGIIGLPRQAAKDINQGLAYGMGVDKLARTMHISVEEAEERVKTYHRRLPYPKKLAEHCQNMAQQRGWIRLIDGARRHFDAWQPAGYRDVPPVQGLEKARAAWPHARLERAFCHKAMNSAAQGGSARQMKRAMVAVYDAGLVPLIQMHDELCFSVTTRRECQIAHDCMIEAVRLQVPMVIDMEAGPDWGHAKKSLEEMGL